MLTDIPLISEICCHEANFREGKSEIRISNSASRFDHFVIFDWLSDLDFGIRFSFEFVSDFYIRISDFRPARERWVKE
jgi:hypothetical protein